MQGVLPFDAATTNVEPGTRHLEPEFIRHPRARRYVIHVRPDGAVRVTLPRRGSLREARAFMAQHQAWIERERRRLEEERERPRATELPSLSHEAERAARERARVELPLRLRQLGAEHGLSVGKVSVRNQRYRWGSCSPDGHICLNWRLVVMPAWVRDYVLVHELMHLRRLDHSRKFWKLVAAACPEYQEARAWLRVNHPSV